MRLVEVQLGADELAQRTTEMRVWLALRLARRRHARSPDSLHGGVERCLSRKRRDSLSRAVSEIVLGGRSRRVRSKEKPRR